ncbi:hypothetical protein [Haladaptatus sp. NG-SE-30]
MSDAARFSVDDPHAGAHRTTTGLLREAVGRLGRDPTLLVPFFVAGVVLGIVDWLRRIDPIPTTVSDSLRESGVTVTFLLYPTGTETTGLRLAALVDLKFRYLLWAVGLELLALLAVGIAGWLTFTRAMDAERTMDLTRNGLASYLGFIVVIQSSFRLLGLFDGLGWVTLVVLVGLLAAFVRLFVAPALVATGVGIRTAVTRSARLTTGEGVTVFGLVLAIGFSAWILGSIPVVGAFVSALLVAPVHAISIVVFLESRPNA